MRRRMMRLKRTCSSSNVDPNEAGLSALGGGADFAEMGGREVEQGHPTSAEAFPGSVIRVCLTLVKLENRFRW